MAAKKSTGRAVPSAKAGAKAKAGKTLTPKSGKAEVTRSKSGALRGEPANLKKAPARKAPAKRVPVAEVPVVKVPLESIQVERVRLEKIPVTGRLVKPGGIDRGHAKALEDLITGATEITVSAGAGKTTTITGVLLSVIRDVTVALEHGESVTVLGADPEADLAGAEISSQEAADLLNVSRPHVVKLARTGQLAHRMVGNRHRFNLTDVLAYAEQMRSTRADALAAIVPDGGYTAEDF